MINIKNPILNRVPVPIVTPRLILRPPQEGDGAALHEAKIESWDHITKWMPWAKTLGTVDDDEAVVREAYAKYIRREDFMMFGFARDTGRFIIGTGLHRFNWETRRFEIGYWVRASEHGKGYATEAANALTRYAFGALEAKAVVIEYADGNDKSRRVIEKLGFEKEGTARMDMVLPDGSQTDRHIYARTTMEGLPGLTVRWG
jgi:RimJ/RimL family protein N-acetyltransferase